LLRDLWRFDAWIKTGSLCEKLSIADVAGRVDIKHHTRLILSHPLLSTSLSKYPMLPIPKRSVLPLLLIAALSGCAIHQTVKPVDRFNDKEICVIENPSVKAGFIDAYKRALSNKGYLVRQLPSSASIVECNITTTYNATWRWDLALYMAYAEIKVYNNGKPIGEAKYDSQRGGANMGKFIDADKKINELANQLFPGGAGL
jgi:hypothetical protein